MAKKTKRKGTVISNIFYAVGVIVIFAGIWFIKDNFLLGIKVMPAGYALMFIGLLLGEYEVGCRNDL